MGTDDNDFLKLNALIDGELPPSERAQLANRLATDRDFARAHATLARLKACVNEVTEDAASIALPRRHRLPRAVGWGLAAAAASLAALILSSDLPPHRQARVTEPLAATAVTLAAFSHNIMVPTLEEAGLKLAGFTFDTAGGVPVLLARYRGPHGCRLDLRAHPAGTELPMMAGTNRYVWVAGDLAYELIGHGMPAWRFALIAQAAERQTQADGGRYDARKLREARAGAPPCTG